MNNNDKRFFVIVNLFFKHNFPLNDLLADQEECDEEAQASLIFSPIFPLYL